MYPSGKIKARHSLTVLKVPLNPNQSNYPEKFTRDNVIAPSVLLSVIIFHSACWGRWNLGLNTVGVKPRYHLLDKHVVRLEAESGHDGHQFSWCYASVAILIHHRKRHAQLYIRPPTNNIYAETPWPFTRELIPFNQCFPTHFDLSAHRRWGVTPSPPSHAQTTLFFTEIPIYFSCTPI